MNKAFLYICVFLSFTFISNLFCQEQKRKIGIGFSSKLFPETDVRDAQASIEIWSRELIKTKKLDFDVSAYIYDDLKKIESAILNDGIGLVALQALDYLFLKKRVSLEPALVSSNNEETKDEFIVLVSKNSGITNISQLKGKIIALQSVGKGEIAKIWFETYLMKENLPQLEKLFKEVKYLKKESQIIFQEFFQQADVCIVSNNAYKMMVELNPQIGENLKIILKSPKYINNVFLISKNISEKDKQTILSIIKDVKKFQTGKQILRLFKVNELVTFSETDLSSLEELAKEYNLLMQKKRLK